MEMLQQQSQQPQQRTTTTTTMVTILSGGDYQEIEEDAKRPLLTKRALVALIVYFALLFDNVLLTVIVPILPDYLAEINNKTLKLAFGREIAHPTIILQQRPPSLPVSDYLLNKHTIPGTGQILTKSITTPTIAPTGVVSHSAVAAAAGIGLLTTTTGRTASAPAGPGVHASLLANENGAIGLLLAIKAVVQLIFNPIVGNLSAKVSYQLPIAVGTFCLLLSSTGFALAESYRTLLLARAMHGIGSSCISVCGMSLVAQYYPEEARRSRVMGIILGSIAAGVLIGYPFGSVLFDFSGKTAPFVILSVLISIILVIQLIFLYMMRNAQQVNEVKQEMSSWKSLLRDQMIFSIFIAIFISTSAMAILEPCLPIWLLQYIRPSKWQLGTVFIPDSLGYFVGTNFFGSIAYNFGQIKISCISLCLVGISSILLPLATHVSHLMLPHFILGLGIGIIDAALVPLLATFVDDLVHEKRHNDGHSSYGAIYAIQQTSVSMAYCLAPLIGGELAQSVGFCALMTTIGCLNVIYAFVLFYNYKVYTKKKTNGQADEIRLTDSSSRQQYRQLYNSITSE